MTQLINKFQLGGKTEDGVSSGKWIQVDDETVTPQYSLKPVEITAEHPLWSMPGYKGLQSKYRNFTLNDKNLIYKNIIAHNQAGVDYLKNIGKVGLTTLGVVGTPVAALSSPLAFAGGIAGGIMTDEATKAVSKGKYNNFGELAGDKLGMDPYFASYLNPGVFFGGLGSSRIPVSAVKSTVKQASSAVKSAVSEAALLAKEDMAAGATMISDVLFPSSQRVPVLAGNYGQMNAFKNTMLGRMLAAAKKPAKPKGESKTETPAPESAPATPPKEKTIKHPFGNNQPQQTWNQEKGWQNVPEGYVLKENPDKTVGGWIRQKRSGDDTLYFTNDQVRTKPENLLLKTGNKVANWSGKKKTVVGLIAASTTLPFFNKSLLGIAVPVIDHEVEGFTGIEKPIQKVKNLISSSDSTTTATNTSDSTNTLDSLNRQALNESDSLFTTIDFSKSE